MIKKLLIAGIVLAAGLSASAGTFTVYQNGQLGANLNPSDWWNGSFNFTAASPDGEDVKVFEFKPAGGANGYANASMGIQMIKPGNTGALHSATLNFKYYAQGTGDYTIRLTGKGQFEAEEYKFTVTDAEAGKWNEVSYVVAQQQPSVAQQWKEDANYGEGFVFSVILTNGVENSAIYFNDIEYTNTDDAWAAPEHGVTAPTTVPMPDMEGKDVLVLMSKGRQADVKFGFGEWGSGTSYETPSIDGASVFHVRNFSYFGWEFSDPANLDVTDYNYLHIDYWTLDGNTFGITPVKTGGGERLWEAETVEQKQWNSYDIPMSYFNFENIFQMKFDKGNHCEAYIANVYFYKDENVGGEEPEQPEQPGEKGATYYGSLTGNFGATPFTMTYSATWNENGTVTFDANINPTVDGLVAQLFANGARLDDFTNLGNGNFTITTTAAYEAGTKPFAFYAAFAGGNTEIMPLDYVVGSSNDAPEQPEPDQPTEPEEGNNAVWYGQTEIEGFTADWNIKFNTDRTLTFSAEMTVEKTVGENERNVHIFGSSNNTDEWVKLYDNDGTGIYTGTTTGLFVLDKEVSWEWYLPVEGGVYQQSNKYIVGSSNEAPKAIRINASVDNITANSAEIAYEVTVSDETAYKVYYKTPDTDAVEAIENPIKLTNLAEKTDYIYELYAVMGEGEETVESRHVTVSFKTVAENAVRYEFNDYVKAQFKNAYREGEDESLRRTIFASLPFTIVYDIDETATYSIDLSEVADIVGLTPQIYWNGFRTLIKRDDSDIWEYNFGVQVLEEEVAISHYLAYNGGTVDINLKNEKVYTKWGDEKAPFELGEPTDITLSASKNVVKVNEPIILTTVATDADGYYLAESDMDVTVEGGPYLLDGVVLQLTEMKGERTVTAKLGDITKSITVNALVSPEALDLIAGTKGITDEENIMENTVVENVTDNNPGTELRWSCANTQEHYLIYDLGDEGKYIEAIDLLFEGAYATRFTITLTNTVPEELGAQLSALAAATEDVVFEPAQNNTQHYFTQDPAGTHRYVVLRTSEALNTGWGIKIKDMKVYGTSQKPTTTGVADIATEVDENAPVEYYNLQGVRVANPANGLYIRRQGNTTTKVLIK